MTKINWKLFDVLSKSLAVLVVVALACNLAWVHLYKLPHQHEERMNVFREQAFETLSQIETADVSLADFTSGNWVFVDDDWETQMYPESDSRFTRIPEVPRVAKANFDHEGAIAAFRKIAKSERQLGDGWNILETERTVFGQVMITHNDTLQVTRAKMQTANGPTIIERRPKSDQTNAAQSLLPVFDNFKQTATRENAQGKVVAAILKSPSGDARSLNEFWRSNGWDVRPLVELDSAPPPAASNRYRCVKEEENSIVDATFLFSENETIVVLTRVQ